MISQAKMNLTFALHFARPPPHLLLLLNQKSPVSTHSPIPGPHGPPNDTLTLAFGEGASRLAFVRLAGSSAFVAGPLVAGPALGVKSV